MGEPPGYSDRDRMKIIGALILTGLALTPPANVISFGSGRAHAVALTFDAGADRGYAPQILSTLERNRLHASFGMTGRWASANPDLVRRMARDGDAFIN